MSSLEGPVSTTAMDRHDARSPGFARRNRLRAARADFFLDDDGRLTDEERALMGAALRQLVADMADELLSTIPPLASAQSEQSRPALYRRLRAAGLLDRSGIVALLLRRADEQRLATSPDPDGSRLVSALVADPDAAIADAAMALTIARGRRRDRFGRIGLEFDDLDAEDAVALVYALAAALATGQSDAPSTEQDLLAAARQYLGRHDEGLRLEAVVSRLAHGLVSAGRDDDEFLVRVASDRDAFLLVALLAERSGIDLYDAWSMFVQGDAMVLARLASCSRDVTARIIAAFDPQLELTADQAIEQFDGLEEADVARIRRAMRTDPHFRMAVERLDRRDG